MASKKRLMIAATIALIALIAARVLMSITGVLSPESGTPGDDGISLSADGAEESSGGLGYVYVYPGQVLMLRSNLEEESTATVEIFSGKYREEPDVPEDEQASVDDVDEDEEGEALPVLDESVEPLKVVRVTGSSSENFELHTGAYTIRITLDEGASGDISLKVV